MKRNIFGQNQTSTAKSAEEIEIAILNILRIYETMIDKGANRINTTIENCRFVDIFKLHSFMMSKDMPCRLYMPGELMGCEKMILSYNPGPGCYITIESEECVILKPKINLINYN